MPRSQGPTRHGMLLVIVWTGIINGGHTVSLLAQSATTRMTEPITSSDEMLDVVIQRRAATRLLHSIGKDAPMETKVAWLIDQLVLRDRDKVQAAVTGLVMLGPSAVPSIVGRIDDRRSMPVMVIAFENRSPKAIESLAQLGVVEVVDCLNLILSVLTGENHGDIVIVSVFSDTTSPKAKREFNAERHRIIEGWRASLAQARAKPTPRAPVKSLPAAKPAGNTGRRSR